MKFPCPYHEPLEDYEDFFKNKNDKYNKQMQNIIDNIKQTSLEDKDKRKLLISLRRKIINNY